VNILLRSLFALFLAFAPLLATSATIDEAIVVIVNKDNPNTIDLAYVARIYTGATLRWPDGTPVFALDQAEDSAARDAFSRDVVGRSVAALRGIWSQNIFSGKALPPKLASPDTEMKRLVAQNRHAIGYVLASQVDDTVRVVKR
jgi:ABC-type phosphate transport system substrate-binding protein